MTNFLESIQRGRQPKPPRVLLYGVEGIGKSTFGSEAPKPIFIQTEDGLDEIDCDRFPLATKFDDVIAALKTLCQREARLRIGRDRLARLARTSCLGQALSSNTPSSRSRRSMAVTLAATCTPSLCGVKCSIFSTCCVLAAW